MSGRDDVRTTDLVARLERVPMGGTRIRVAGVAGAGTFFDGFDAISLAVVLPVIVATFKISFAEASSIVSAGYIGQMVGALVVGRVADRWGRRRTFVVALAFFGLLSLGCAAAQSADGLLAFRLVQGLGLGAEVPIAATLVNEYLGRKNRGRNFLLYQASFVWGLFFAPLTALLLTRQLSPEASWRVLFAIAALPLLVAVLAWFKLPESPRWLVQQGRVDEARAIVERMESEAEARGHTLDAPEPLPPASVEQFRLAELFGPQYLPRTIMVAIVWFTAFFVSYGASVWLPSIYVQVGHLEPSRSLELTVVTAAVQVAVTYVMVMIVGLIGRKLLLTIGCSFAAFGSLYGLVVVGLGDNTEWGYLLSAGVMISIGISVPSALLYLYTGELFPTRMRATATAGASACGRLASVISPFVIGHLLDKASAATPIFAVLAVSALIAAVTLAIGGVETRGKVLEEISA